MTVIKREVVQPDSMRGHYAGFVTRYIAFLIDILLIAVASTLIITVTRVTIDFFGIDKLLAQIGQTLGLSPEEPTVNNLFSWLAKIAGSLFVFGLYSVVSWVLVGKTVGKALMGLRVLAEDGRGLSIKKAIIRALGYYISAWALLMGFLWVLVDDRRQAWHDKFAGSLVVYEWDARHEERFVAAIERLRRAQGQRQQALERAAREAVEPKQSE
jgi:uncharacterized RDD family membrane protein YckC